jgi:hypothetical protein
VGELDGAVGVLVVVGNGAEEGGGLLRSAKGKELELAELCTCAMGGSENWCSWLGLVVVSCAVSSSSSKQSSCGEA